MIPVIGINSSSAPFMADIGRLLKLYETRFRRTLHRFVGQRVILAETKQGGYLAMYSVVIDSELCVSFSERWEALRPVHRVQKGSKFDWKPDTKVKYLYRIKGLRRLNQFMVPEGIRHGRTWMEYNK